MKREGSCGTIKLPKYHSEGAAGFDIQADLSILDFGTRLSKRGIVIPPHHKVIIHTGLIFEIPPGYELQIRCRSGIAANTGLMIANGVGTVDSDYRGEVKIIIYNMGDKAEYLHHGDRIAQGVIAPVIRATFEEVDELSHTERNAGHFGSTGV